MAHDKTVHASTARGGTTELDALVIGAGFAGLYQLLCLRDRLGLSVQALEAGGGVGGTWYWNRYPGARCDSESHVYWYTFSPELMREWEWSERYPGQVEILRYLNFVADRFDLKRDIRFNTRVVAASYEANRWQVRTEGGETYVVKFLITAVGCLSTANVPDFPGLDDFAGDWYHTGQWPHEGVDLTGGVPTVFISIGFPVELGLVQSLAHPGGNMTGITAEAALETNGPARIHRAAR
jgi:cation diffusion facilitator CzcD-associated flavoprotein CzcO